MAFLLSPPATPFVGDFRICSGMPSETPALAGPLIRTERINHPQREPSLYWPEGPQRFHQQRTAPFPQIRALRGFFRIGRRRRKEKPHVELPGHAYPQPSEGKAVEESRTLRESQGAGKSARSWTAPVLWR